MTQDLLIGQQLADYKINRFLGEGAFAKVYEGEDVYLDRKVAIKIMKISSLPAREITTYKESFQKEAKIIARLEHPNIIRIIKFGFSQGLQRYGLPDGTPFLVMSYAAYGTIRDKYPELSVLDYTTIAKYTLQIAQALQYAHDQTKAVIHRDIKPENLFLDAQDNVLLGDF